MRVWSEDGFTQRSHAFGSHISRRLIVVDMVMPFFVVEDTATKTATVPVRQVDTKVVDRGFGVAIIVLPAICSYCDAGSSAGSMNWDSAHVLSAFCWTTKEIGTDFEQIGITFVW